MKILFTGGGTGGHFYPIIAVAESINEIVKERRLLKPALYYMASSPYDQRMLFDNGITYVQMPAGKLRRYFSIKNFFDFFKTGAGIIKSLWKIFTIYPDVVFGKGGYDSFPALFAAKLFKIPVVIHESDSVPGRVNLWASKFANDIAVSYPEAAKFFPNTKVAFTGNPIRKEVLQIEKEGARAFLKLEENVPVLLILGGSLGAEKINDSLLEILPELVERFQIIHQTGKKNYSDVSKTADVILSKSSYKTRYRAISYLSDLDIKMSVSSANLIISRAGSTIFEIAAWGLPSIIIPIGESVSHDQTKNAFNYARSGGALVIEESNLSPHILLSEINNLFDKPELMEKMRAGAKSFAHIDAGKTIALKLIEIALSHEV